MDEGMPLRRALRAATPFPLEQGEIRKCLTEAPRDELLRHALEVGLVGLKPQERRGSLWRAVGEVAEAVAEIVLDEAGYSVFWHISEPGAHGVDLLFLSPDEQVLALEVKGTLRPGAVPRLTPSRLRQMSREWLNDPKNPAMQEWELEADDLFTAVMVIDLARSAYRVALSADFERFHPVAKRAELLSLRWLDAR